MGFFNDEPERLPKCSCGRVMVRSKIKFESVGSSKGMLVCHSCGCYGAPKEHTPQHQSSQNVNINVIDINKSPSTMILQDCLLSTALLTLMEKPNIRAFTNKGWYPDSYLMIRRDQFITCGLGWVYTNTKPGSTFELYNTTHLIDKTNNWLVYSYDKDDESY